MTEGRWTKIGAVAAVFALVPAFWVLFQHDGGPDVGGPISHSTSSATTPAPAPAIPRVPAPDPTPTWALIWNAKPVIFAYDHGLNLDVDPIQVEGLPNVTFFTDTGTDRRPTFSVTTRGADLGKTPPTLQGCQDALQLQGAEEVATSIGHTVCIASRSGSRIAAVTVRSWDNGVAFSDMGAAVSIWEKQ